MIKAALKKIDLPMLAVVIAGLIVLWPHLDYQYALAQGDHGRDLYASEQVLHGALPMKDFWWVYGPLMPYYYGLLFKITGFSIKSVLLGKFILKLLAGIFLFLGARALTSTAAAFGACLWFWIMGDDFIFTYNHIGGIAVLTFFILTVFKFIASRKQKYASLAFASIFILGLIKLNFGFCNLFGFLILMWLQRKKASDLAIGASIVAVWALIYGLLIQGLSIPEIRQCLPFWGDDQPYNVTLFGSMRTLWTDLWTTFTSIKAYAVLAVIFGIAFIRILVLIKIFDRAFFKTGAIVLFFLILNMHEYLKSGVEYRVLWAQPLLFMFIFFVIDAGFKRSKLPIRLGVTGVIMITLAVNAWVSIQKVNSSKTQNHYIDLPRAKIYTSQDTNHWIGTITETTKYLNNTIPPNELFFALPYDCLYYFLTGKESPTRQLIFFEHIKIPAAQEVRTIKELESNHVQYVLLSNFYKTDDHYRGVLGSTYCPLIASYIFQNFTPSTQFGDWANTPGWADHHGVVILKRKM